LCLNLNNFDTFFCFLLSCPCVYFIGAFVCIGADSVIDHWLLSSAHK
jgi:hypothetical protein